MKAAVITAPQVRSAPLLEPPYDDEPAARRAIAPPGLSDQPLLPCFGTAGFGLTRSDTVESHIAGENDLDYRASADSVRFCRQRSSSSHLPEPRNHARKLLQALMEMISGVRPLGQLVPWLHETLYFELAERYGAVRQANRRAATHPQHRSRTTDRHPGTLCMRIGSIHGCEPAEGVAEISAVMHDRGRTYAVALRMEGLDGGWRCTTFTVV
ncbi:MAG: Rv3235 family protein [Mycobacteriales bacterium]